MHLIEGFISQVSTNIVSEVYEDIENDSPWHINVMMWSMLKVRYRLFGLSAIFPAVVTLYITWLTCNSTFVRALSVMQTCSNANSRLVHVLPCTLHQDSKHQTEDYAMLESIEYVSDHLSAECTIIVPWVKAWMKKKRNEKTKQKIK